MHLLQAYPAHHTTLQISLTILASSNSSIIAPISIASSTYSSDTFPIPTSTISPISTPLDFTASHNSSTASIPTVLQNPVSVTIATNKSITLPSHPMRTRAQSRIFKPKIHVSMLTPTTNVSRSIYGL